MTWLIDKSADVRLADGPDHVDWIDRIDRGLVHISTVTRLEIGYSMQPKRDLDAEVTDLLGRFVGVSTPPRAEDRSMEIQTLLTDQGQHRAPSIPDLLIAATAEALGHTVLHVDKHFDLITAITHQPVERLPLTM